MSLIEQAAQRLEQLRQAGVDMPSSPVEPVLSQSSGSAPPSQVEPAERAEASRTVIQSPEMVMSRRINLNMEILSASGIIRPDSPRSQLADEYRVIKRPLIENAMGKGAAPVKDGNLIMVTSALPGEGKTFNAINLAMSIAMELDHRVLLVDADVAKPSLLSSLGLPPGPGLLDLLLSDDVDMSDVMLRTNVDKLSLLPSGTPHANSTELLASDAMTALIEEMGRRYSDRVVIFDSPPLLQTTQARVLAVHMGQVVMVVQAEKTLQSQVQHALTTIEACPIKLLLLNQARGGGNDAYGYGYGYGLPAAPIREIAEPPAEVRA